MSEHTDALRAIVAKYASPDPKLLAKLPKPTKRDNPPGKCSVCGGWHGLPAVHLDYLGHADVTLALLDVDPEWTWEPAAMNESGPVITKEGNRLVMWGYLSVLGMRRLCVGTCGGTQPDAEKELIGDLLRNGAMRFGIGTNLWSKSEASELAGHEDGASKPAAARKAASPSPMRVLTNPTVDDLLGPNGGDTAVYAREDAEQRSHPAATEAQVQKIQIAMKGHGDREAKLAWLGEFVGRTLASSKELTRVEAGKVIDHLEAEATR